MKLASLCKTKLSLNKLCCNHVLETTSWAVMCPQSFPVFLPSYWSADHPATGCPKNSRLSTQRDLGPSEGSYRWATLTNSSNMTKYTEVPPHCAGTTICSWGSVEPPPLQSCWSARGQEQVRTNTVCENARQKKALCYKELQHDQSIEMEIIPSPFVYIQKLLHQSRRTTNSFSWLQALLPRVFSKGKQVSGHWISINWITHWLGFSPLHISLTLRLS